jgi:hypothetical protein
MHPLEEEMVVAEVAQGQITDQAEMVATEEILDMGLQEETQETQETQVHHHHTIQ